MSRIRGPGAAMLYERAVARAQLEPESAELAESFAMFVGDEQMSQISEAQSDIEQLTNPTPSHVGVKRGMPTYQTEAGTIWALRIAAVTRAGLRFEDEAQPPVSMMSEWLRLQQPEAGGYYVLDDEGIATFMSAEDFEAATA